MVIIGITQEETIKEGGGGWRGQRRKSTIEKGAMGEGEGSVCVCVWGRGGGGGDRDSETEMNCLRKICSVLQFVFLIFENCVSCVFTHVQFLKK